MSTNPPLVCICVPCYNSEATIGATLESLVSQTYRNIKIVVVDNASTDRTCGIVGGFMARDERVELRANGENIGAEGNFTRCLQEASGEYTAIFHADDVYLPEYVFITFTLL